MKVFGIILLVFAALNFIAFIIGTAGGYPEAVRSLSPALMFAALGAYLVHRANQKEKEKKDKEKWNNN